MLVADSDTAAAAVAATAAVHEASPNGTVTDGEHETRGEDGGAGGYICFLCVQ